MTRRFVVGAVLCAAAILGLAPGAQANDCVVTGWALARAVVAGAPVDKGRRFAAAGRVHAWVKLNCTKVEGPVVFRFERDGKPYAAVKVPVRASAGWRAWASVRALPGEWRVVLQIGKRRMLDDTFTVSR